MRIAHGPKSAKQEADQHRSLAAAKAVWSAAQPIAPKDPAGRYLAARACALPPSGSHLCWIESHQHPGGYSGPVLVALVTEARTAAPLTVHRTWLDPARPGHKAPIERPRLLWPGLTKAGGLVRLWPDAEISHGLAVAEGIETALALARGFGLAWSTLDAGNLAALPVLEGIEALTVAVDHDPAGMRAWRAVADRWQRAGREVRCVLAPQPGADFADLAADVP